MNQLWRNTLVAAMACLAFGMAAIGSAHLRITGGLSNFDCWNDSGDDCNGFEIEFEDCDEHDIIHTYGGSRFGAPTVSTVGTGTNRKAVVRYHSDTQLVSNGGMTHFGVTLSSLARPSKVNYYWIPNVGWHPPVPVALPNHKPELVRSGNVEVVRNSITNSQPNEGKVFWVLPWRNIVNREVSLEELMSDSAIVLLAEPMGGGPDGLIPEQLDPGNTWMDDDPVDQENTASNVFWFDVYEDVVTYDANGDPQHEPGQFITRMMDAAVTSTSDPTPYNLTMWDTAVFGSQTSNATAEIFGTAPFGGAYLTAESDNPNAQVNSPLFIPAGEAFVDFPITTTPVSQLTNVNISVSSNGKTITRGFAVKPPECWYTMAAPLTIRGGATTTMTVFLTTPAPSVGTKVLLEANSDLIEFPNDTASRTPTSKGSMIIPSGTSSRAIVLKTKRVRVGKNVILRATAGGITKTVTIRLNP